MKIIQFVQKPQLRGAEIFASQLSNQLLNSGCRVEMVSLFNGPATLPFRGSMTLLGANSSLRLIDIRAWWRINRIIRSLKPDIVQANAGDTLKYLALSKLFFRWKTPIVYRNANMMSEFIDSRIKFVINRFFVSQVAHVISVSELCRQDFMKTFRFDERKATTVPIGIELREVGNLSEDLRGFFSEGPILVNVASLVPEKNQHGLLDIFVKVREKLPSVRLAIVGEGKLRNSLIARIDELGLNDCVRLLGQRTDVLEIIQAADIFVLPSLIEGLPGVILEAMFCKTPVVANNVGGISEVITHGRTGWLVSRDNNMDFVDRLIQVLQLDVKERQMVIEAAHATVVEQYNNVRIAERFLSAYMLTTQDV